MKNYLKMTLMLSALLLLSLVSVSAYPVHPSNSYYKTIGSSDVSDIVVYNEDLHGEIRGFSISRKSSLPQQSRSMPGCDYYDWTYNMRKCKRTAHYGGYSVDSYEYDAYGERDRRASYDQDKAVKLAFDTYQKSSKQEHDRKMEELRLRHRNYGYGYGYSGARYYRYGW